MVSIAGWVTLIAVAIVVVVAVYVGTKARQTIPGGYAAVYGVRASYAGVLIVLLLLALVASIRDTPYAALRGPEPSVRVEVVGMMWAWQMKKRESTETAAGPLVLPFGKVVEFEVTSSDVNHGFGVYDDAGHLLAQAQAMPGYVNRLRYVFAKPGRYHVACLEYCGIAHPVMLSEITVQ